MKKNVKKEESNSVEHVQSINKAIFTQNHENRKTQRYKTESHSLSQKAKQKDEV